MVQNSNTVIESLHTARREKSFAATRLVPKSLVAEHGGRSPRFGSLSGNVAADAFAPNDGRKFDVIERNSALPLDNANITRDLALG